MRLTEKQLKTMGYGPDGKRLNKTEPTKAPPKVRVKTLGQPFKVSDIVLAASGLRPDGSHVPTQFEVAGNKLAVHLDNTIGGVFIPCNVPSSKNSRDIVTNRKTGNSVLIPSRAVTNYKKATANYWPAMARTFHDLLAGKDKPYRLQFYFARKTRATFDFQNAVQILCDLFQDHGWLTNDDVRTMLPVPPPSGDAYFHDPKNPGVYIQVL